MEKSKNSKFSQINVPNYGIFLKSTDGIHRGIDLSKDEIIFSDKSPQNKDTLERRRAINFRNLRDSPEDKLDKEFYGEIATEFKQGLKKDRGIDFEKVIAEIEDDNLGFSDSTNGKLRCGFKKSMLKLMKKI